MSSRTKIVVLHRKEVAYTAIFLALAIVMIIVVCVMFGGRGEQETGSQPAEETLYIPGVYTSTIELNDNSFDVQVTVDANHINSIELVNLSETATVMYPLMEPTLEDIAEQIYESQSTADIAYSEENKYTSMLLLEAIDAALDKAAAGNGEGENFSP